MTLEQQIEALVERWNRALLDKDVVAAAELRAAGYTATLPDGALLTRDEELAMVASPGHVIESIDRRSFEVRSSGDEAIAIFENRIVGEYMGERIDELFQYTISFRRTGDGWRAYSSRLAAVEAPGQQAWKAASAEPPPPHPSSSLSRTLKSWAKAKLRRAASGPAPTFQELAYLPYKPGQDYVIPARADEGANTEPAELPVPPTELWLGYNYPAHGKAHVQKMLEIVYASGFLFSPGDRVLDFGCGAGRMIRHLRELSGTCEIWGADTSAEHVYWCKQNLSPPFNFVTTTKVPHLPFEDASFQFIYCGSVFTHIDDLADAWLLELRRILAPGGRLYLTIHDEHTVELLETGRHDHAGVVRWIKSREVYQESKAAFGMLVLGRDSDSQVFYDRACFSKTLRPMFEILSITPEAYFYQTAFLLEKK